MKYLERITVTSATFFLVWIAWGLMAHMTVAMP